MATAKAILGSHSIFEIVTEVHRNPWHSKGKLWKLEKGGEEEMSLLSLGVRFKWWSTHGEWLERIAPVLCNFKCACRDSTYQGFDNPKVWQVRIRRSSHLTRQCSEASTSWPPDLSSGKKKKKPESCLVACTPGSLEKSNWVRQSFLLWRQFRQSIKL